MRALAVVALATLLQGPPDFSGRWEFDREKTMQPGPDGRIVLAAMLGDAVVVRQTADRISFSIDAGGRSHSVV